MFVLLALPPLQSNLSSDIHTHIQHISDHLPTDESSEGNYALAGKIEREINMSGSVCNYGEPRGALRNNTHLGNSSNLEALMIQKQLMDIFPELLTVMVLIILMLFVSILPPVLHKMTRKWNK